MLSIKSLLSLSIALLILSVVLLFLFKKLRKSKLVNIFFIFSCILLFVSMFEIVYCAFFFQWGYPAGPELTNGDWLSFLGGYLEFSGALVMAWLVYRQSETINKLAMQEYRIGVKAIPDKIELKEYLEEDQSHVFCTYMDKGVPKLYIKHDCVLDTKATKTQLLHKNIPFFYFHIINKGKTKIERLKFNAVSRVY